MSPSNRKLPEEFDGVATLESVSALEEKIKKCYSKEDYSEFQNEVEKIALKVLGNDDGRTIIKKHAKESAAEYSVEVGWTKKTFWVPTIIAVIASIAAIAAVVVAIVK